MTEARFDLAQLASHELAELGARVRRCAEGRTATTDEIAAAIVDTLWSAFQERSPPVLALVRLYCVRTAGELAPALRVQAGADGDARVLVLAASRGLEPAWNDVAASEAHRAIALADPAAAARAPIVAQLIADAAAGSREVAAASTAFIADAAGDPRIPAQRGFALRYGVRSVIGCGGMLPDAGFAIALFTRIIVSPAIAAGFAAIALHATIALSHASDLRAAREAVLATRSRAFDRLVRTQEFLFIKRAGQLARDSEALHQRAAELDRKLTDETAARERQRERVQRAMLNVIEDLREARSELERRVAQRTLELEQTNAELRASNGELEQFAYVASHDLQEPLRTIAGYLQLIEERYGDRLDGDGLEFIAYAVRGAQRLQELIDALLTYSGIARAPIGLEIVPLDRALDEALAAMARALAESRAQLARAPLPAVRGDAVLLRQVFQNLLSNAIKFSGPEPPRIEIAASDGEREVGLTVRDHGLGFDPKYAEQIFKVFRRLQRKLPGTGIGLAICKKIIERHGGSIRADATPGRGATFYLTLPAIEVTE